MGESMKQLFLTIDRLLRGEFTREQDLREGRVKIQLQTLLVTALVLGALYGIFMGLYSVLRPESPSIPQLLATTAKVPLLFLLTLAVTFPSLYVFSALAGSRTHFTETLRLLLVGITLNLALLASFGPITGFFTLSTDSYPFMIVLNVIFFAAGGVAGVIFIYRALGIILEAEPAAGSAQFQKAALRARRIFYAWAIIYGVVGAQMGWILRPFIGSPELPFQFFRERESNFFEAFFGALRELLG